MTDHVPTVSARSMQGQDADSPVTWIYHGRCSCGWAGVPQWSERPASQAADRHVALRAQQERERRESISGGYRALPAPLRPMAETVHHCPPTNTGLTLCCHRSPFELPATDRLTVDETAVTCR